MGDRRRLIKITLCAVGVSLIGLTGLVVLVTILRDDLVTLDD